MKYLVNMSINKLTNQVIFDLQLAGEMISASAEEEAMQFFLLFYQSVGLFAIINMLSVVDFLVFVSPAQSAPVNPICVG